MQGNLRYEGTRRGIHASIPVHPATVIMPYFIEKGQHFLARRDLSFIANKGKLIVYFGGEGF